MRLILLLVCTVFILLKICKANDSPGFFLKITKNVPRLGRRSPEKEYDNYFLKNMKTIPRIGKRNEEVSHFQYFQNLIQIKLFVDIGVQ